MVNWCLIVLFMGAGILDDFIIWLLLGSVGSLFAYLCVFVVCCLCLFDCYVRC